MEAFGSLRRWDTKAAKGRASVLKGLRGLVLVLAVALVLSLPACTPDRQPAALKPKLRPPVIKVAGVLRVGVDEAYPPFASRQGSAVVGLDADVAAALAEKLGLRLELVDVKPQDAGKALRDGKVDAVLGGMRISDAVLAGATFAGTYLTDGPGLFASKDTSASAGSLAGHVVAVQKDSAAAGLLTQLPGSPEVTTFPTLRAALEAGKTGKADLVAGDAVVAAYIARDIPGIRFAGQLGEASPLGVAVAEGAPELESAVRDALDTLATGGVLDAIRTKWVGDLPELYVGTRSPDATASVGITTIPTY
jgi:polar amino acid transport system substrate-binding protein